MNGYELITETFSNVMLTNIFLLLLLFHKYTHNIIDLWLLALIVICISSWIVYISPRYFVVDKYSIRITLDGPHMHAMHVLVHIIPLLIVFHLYFSFYKKHKCSWRTANTLLLVFTYFWIYNPVRLYRMNEYALVGMFILACAIYLLV